MRRWVLGRPASGSASVPPSPSWIFRPGSPTLASRSAGSRWLRRQWSGRQNFWLRRAQRALRWCIATRRSAGRRTRRTGRFHRWSSYFGTGIVDCARCAGIRPRLRHRRAEDGAVAVLSDAGNLSFGEAACRHGHRRRLQYRRDASARRSSMHSHSAFASRSRMNAVATWTKVRIGTTCATWTAAMRTSLRCRKLSHISTRCAGAMPDELQNQTKRWRKDDDGSVVDRAVFRARLCRRYCLVSCHCRRGDQDPVACRVSGGRGAGTSQSGIQEAYRGAIERRDQGRVLSEWQPVQGARSPAGRPSRRCRDDDAGVRLLEFGVSATFSLRAAVRIPDTRGILSGDGRQGIHDQSLLGDRGEGRTDRRRPRLRLSSAREHQAPRL